MSLPTSSFTPYFALDCMTPNPGTVESVLLGMDAGKQEGMYDFVLDIVQLYARERADTVAAPLQCLSFLRHHQAEPILLSKSLYASKVVFTACCTPLAPLRRMLRPLMCSKLSKNPYSRGQRPWVSAATLAALPLLKRFWGSLLPLPFFRMPILRESFKQPPSKLPFYCQPPLPWCRGCQGYVMCSGPDFDAALVVDADLL